MKAVIEFETLQEAGPAGHDGVRVATSSMTVTGSTVTGGTAALQPAASTSPIR